MSNSLQLPDQFDHVCKLVAHEDNLVNIRTTWALVFQGFLFTAFVSGIGLYEKLEFEGCGFNPIAVGIFVVCVLGVLSAAAAYCGVKAAEDQLRVITKWWAGQLAKSEDESYPKIYIHADGKTKTGASIYFVVLAISWVLLGGLVVLSPAPVVIS